MDTRRNRPLRDREARKGDLGRRIPRRIGSSTVAVKLPPARRRRRAFAIACPWVMQGNPQVIQALNDLLTGELTSMDVYLLHAQMCEDWGHRKIAERLAHEFDDEKAHACKLIERIIFLGGTPNMASRDAFEVGDNVEAMLRADLELEYVVANNLNDAIRLAVDSGDNVTREMLVELLRDTEEDHILWLETQLRLIDTVGLEHYLQEQM